MKAFVLIGIAWAQIEAGDKEQALETLKQAGEAAQKIEFPLRRLRMRTRRNLL